MPSSIVNPGFGSSTCGTLSGAPGASPSNCGFNGTGPYWDNDSQDGVKMNIGYILTGMCGTNPGTDCPTNYNPTGFLSGSNAINGPAPTSIVLDHTGTSAAITFLGSITGTVSDAFGYYDFSNPSILYPILGPGLSGDIGDQVSLNSLSGDYGFYLTEANGVTLYSQASLNNCAAQVFLDPTCDTTDQHFVIFESATIGTYYIGIKDWGLLGGPNNGEGLGDYNDVMFKLTTNSTAVPEPATFVLIAMGLVGLAGWRHHLRCE